MNSKQKIIKTTAPENKSINSKKKKTVADNKKRTTLDEEWGGGGYTERSPLDRNN